ncbi:hypothetical protein [Serratia proteamaculans]|uniref:Uncharacterized protein n=1 Tax=Serratia proteamaculans TaxID=28151 RepID=A0A5Q2VD70_SERPR|nr:hypothetical protein [Serratia proteamaculans]QGH62040.1 hypothetical protein GHV41_14945 [Serratia proteamaculans]
MYYVTQQLNRENKSLSRQMIVQQAEIEQQRKYTEKLTTVLNKNSQLKKQIDIKHDEREKKLQRHLATVRCAHEPVPEPVIRMQREGITP